MVSEKAERNPLWKMRMLSRFTLEEAARLTGYSPSYLSRLETGSRRLNEDVLRALAKTYGCSVTDILDGHHIPQVDWVSEWKKHLATLNSKDTKKDIEIPEHWEIIKEKGSFFLYKEYEGAKVRIQLDEIADIRAMLLNVTEDYFFPKYDKDDILKVTNGYMLKPKDYVIAVEEDSSIKVCRIVSIKDIPGTDTKRYYLLSIPDNDFFHIEDTPLPKNNKLWKITGTYAL